MLLLLFVFYFVVLCFAFVFCFVTVFGPGAPEKSPGDSPQKADYPYLAVLPVLIVDDDLAVRLVQLPDAVPKDRMVGPVEDVSFQLLLVDLVGQADIGPPSNTTDDEHAVDLASSELPGAIGELLQVPCCPRRRVFVGLRAPFLSGTYLKPNTSKHSILGDIWNHSDSWKCKSVGQGSRKSELFCVLLNVCCVFLFCVCVLCFCCVMFCVFCFCCFFLCFGPR